ADWLLALDPATLTGWLAYRPDRLDADLAGRLPGHYFTLLAALLAEPVRPVTELPLLTDAERKQVLREWNPWPSPAPSVCLHELVEVQAGRTPDAVAVVFGDERLSYRELNARANRLAHFLIERGVGPDSRVALCLERSFAMVTAVLGVLKASGAYVPLDPGYPRDRLAFMLRDSGARLVLTQRSLAAALPEGEAVL